MSAVQITDGFMGFSLDHFVIPQHYRADLSYVMIPHGLILSRVEKMAADIYNAYDFAGGARVHILCVLKGGHEFFSDLITVLKRHLAEGCAHVPIAFDFIRVKSYQGLQSSDAKIETSGVDLEQLKEKHVLVVEDMIDTGRTMSMLVPFLEAQGAASVKVAVLLARRTEKPFKFEGDFVGFSIPDTFVVGYCLDYNEIYRDMDHICVMAPSGISRHASPT